MEILQELEKIETSHQRRREIGEWLAKNGDPRPGIGVKDGLPEIGWLPVAPGGQVIIRRVWEPETPDDQARVLLSQDFPVAPFYLAKYLVTYAQYQAFVAAADGFDNPVWWRDMPETCQPQQLAEGHTQISNYPRDNISWYQGVAFARWINQRLQGFVLPHPSGAGALRVGENAQIRLPTEWEWQWAAQNGADQRPYPWGELKTGFANTGEAGLAGPVAVGMYPHGAAACGALDMSGNLMEWCANDKENIAAVEVSSRATKVLRGGDWHYGLEIASCTRADDDTPDRIDILNGFRLALVEST